MKTAEERAPQGKKHTTRCLFQCKVFVVYCKITYHMFSDTRRREEMLFSILSTFSLFFHRFEKSEMYRQAKPFSNQVGQIKV